jgi:hypothetical protein
MPNVRHSDLVGEDLHPPGPHTHPDSDLSSFAVLDGRYYQRASVDALLADRQYKTFVTVGSADADHITDGTADNVQIQDAIDEVAAAGGGVVHIKAGTYDIDNRIVPKDNVTIQGEGWGATVLAGSTSLSNFAVIARAGDSSTPVENITLRDFEIDGTNMNHSGFDSGRKGTVLNYMRNLVIDHVYIHDTPATGMGLDFMDGAIIVNCLVEDCGTAGQGISSGSNGFGLGIGVWGKEPVIIANNIARRNANAGFVIENILDTGTVQSTHFLFLNNQLYENKYGGYIGGGAMGVISNSIIEDNTDEGLWFDQDNNFQAAEFILANNQIQNNGKAGIRLNRQECKNFLIQGNDISGNGEYGIISKGEYMTLTGNQIHDNQLNGFYMDLTAGTTHKNLTFTSNLIYNNGKAGVSGDNDGIRLDGNAIGISDVIVADNHIFDNQGTPTQRYGVVMAGTVANIRIQDNHFSGHTTGATNGASLATVVRNNIGVNPDGLYAQGNVSGATTFNRLNGSTITAMLTGNITVTLTNGVAKGDTLELILTQDATGSRTATWPSNFKKAGGSMTLSTGANAVDVIKMVWDGTNWREVSRALNQS